MWKEEEMREFQDPYCYKGTNVLINNLGIRNEKNLSTYERAHVASKLLALNIRPNNGDFSLKHYLGIHKYLFEEVYPFAGEIRNVDITKGGTYFARFQYIEPELDKILKEMKSELPKVSSMDEYAEKLAGYYLDINIAHPFRDENEPLGQQKTYLQKYLQNKGFTDFGKSFFKKNFYNFSIKLMIFLKYTI